MVGRKKSPRTGALNSELLQRIDNMDDEKDFNPYQAIKRTTINNDELFNDAEYDEEYSSKNDDDGNIASIITGAFLGLVVVGMGALAVWYLI